MRCRPSPGWRLRPRASASGPPSCRFLPARPRWRRPRRSRSISSRAAVSSSGWASRDHRWSRDGMVWPSGSRWSRRGNTWRSCGRCGGGRSRWSSRGPIIRSRTPVATPPGWASHSSLFSMRRARSRSTWLPSAPGTWRSPRRSPTAGSPSSSRPTGWPSSRHRWTRASAQREAGSRSRDSISPPPCPWCWVPIPTAAAPR